MASTSAPAPTGPPVVQNVSSGSSILVNTCQRGNPVLEHIRNVAKEWSDIVPDFQMGRTTCALFLSLKYHRLHPEYIHTRIQRLVHMYTLRILLIHCDITEHQDSIRELTKVCLINNMTIIVAWSPEECGLYLSTFKVYEHKPPDAIRERIDKDHMSILRAALTSIRSVNKTDVTTLKTTFGSFAGIAKATSEQLVKCPGIGQTKARRIKDAFEHPFHNRAMTMTAEDVLPLNAARKQPGAMGPPPVPARAQASSQAENAAARHPRPPSPTWSIELDLNDDDEDEPQTLTAPGTPAPPAPAPPEPSRTAAGDAPLNPRKRAAPRSPSPVWDIELDLNDDELAELDKLDPDPKRPRLDAGT
ncbi:DNA repair protein rad10 [Auricularia subglabra TFB-10046 SS5]|uniref:DNA excision repair protein ERCC-1 n=1 Tax=Auricularia subglabra (strain TFB-10046 / SS5) TaxID=717982 RepID=J0D8H5_AURST|nr:DNA repair protein rad10 [Auricularia subglabra TFB-10046 SS5]